MRITRAVVSDDETGSGGEQVRDRRRRTRRRTPSEPSLIDAGTTQALREHAQSARRGRARVRRRRIRRTRTSGAAISEGTRRALPDRFSYDWVQVDKAVDDGAHVRLHDLRHFHGTMLVGAGVPLPSVRDRLGHSSVTVTEHLRRRSVRVGPAVRRDHGNRARRRLAIRSPNVSHRFQARSRS